MRAFRFLGVYSCLLFASAPATVLGQVGASARAPDPVPLIDRLPGVIVVVTHVGIDDADLGALFDMNTEQPLPDIGQHRQGELAALTSHRFTRALKARAVLVITYRALVAKEGLRSMRRPAG